MTAPGRRAAAWRGRFRRATSVLTGAMLLALAGVTLADVLGRYLLGSPLPGASEMTEILVMAIVFSGLPAVCLDDGHVRVDLLAARLEGPPARILARAARIVVAAVLALVAWRLWEHGLRLGAHGETTVYLRAPLMPVAMAAGALCAASSVIVLAPAAARPPGAAAGEA